MLKISAKSEQLSALIVKGIYNPVPNIYIYIYFINVTWAKQGANTA